jgi:tetratricopeptide (TPR) repeat protein
MAEVIANHAERGIVVFCGAGVSMVAPACLPSWWQMNAEVVHALSRQIEPFCGAERARDWAQQINIRRESGRFPPEFQAELIARRYGASYFKVLQCLDGREPNVVHFALAALARSGHVRAVVTSNFDRLLEVAFEKSGVPLDVCYSTAHFARLASELEAPSSEPPRCQLLKLHGSVDDHLTLVDTLAQRMRGLPPEICTCLRQLLRSHYWLFLGYSGRDLEGNPQYLCLQSELSRAVGFSWMVRDSAVDEPIPAVKAICSMYGERAEAPRGELPDWLLAQAERLLPAGFPRPPTLSDADLDRRRSGAARAIVDHAREWSVHLGPVRAALAIADMLRTSVANPQAAQELLSAVLDAQQEDGVVYVAVANELVNVLAAGGRFDEAVALGERVLARAGSIDLADRAGLLSNLGVIDSMRGMYQQALERFEQAYEVSARGRDEERISVALHNRAMALVSLGRPAEAVSCYEEALEIVRTSGDALAQAQTLNNMGDLLVKEGRYAEAIDVLRRAIELRERLGDDTGVASCLGNIAGAYQRRGELTEARSTYERILITFRRLGDRAQEATTLRNLGLVNQELGEFDEAESLYRQAIALATEHRLEVQRAGGMMKLGSLYRVTERAAESARLFDDALSACRTCGDQAAEADVLNEMGIVHWQEGRLEAAELALKQAIAIWEKLNQPAGLCEAIGNLALVLIDRGERGDAMALLKRKLAISERLHARGLIASALYNIAALLHAQGDLDASLDSFERAQGLYLQTGQTGKAIEILAVMGEICGRQGKIGASLQWFDRAIPLAADVDQQTRIARRLAEVLTLLRKEGYDEIGLQYVERLEMVGSKVEIRKT